VRIGLAKFFSSSSQLINRALNSCIGSSISGLDLGRGPGVGWSVMKQAIGQGAADALVEEDEHESYTATRVPFSVRR
jgi:hypothetical protein